MGREGGLEGVGWGGWRGREEDGRGGWEGGTRSIYNLVLAYKAITIPTNNY